MAHPNKVKGSNYEREIVNKAKEAGLSAQREIVNKAKEAGLSAQRAYASNGKSLGEHEAVDGKIEEFRFQAKRKRSLPKWLSDLQFCINEGYYDIICLREDRGKTLVAMDLDLFFKLLKD